MPDIRLSSNPAAVAAMLGRVRQELSAAFAFSPDSPGVTVNHCPARLDVMGGIAAETGTWACTVPLDRPAATVVVQDRVDSVVQIFSFDELDAHRPFTLCVPWQALADMPLQTLRQSVEEPGRRWAWGVLGTLHGFLGRSQIRSQFGLNVAIQNAVPSFIGLGSDAALAAACALAFSDHLSVRFEDEIDLARFARRMTQDLLGHADALPIFSSLLKAPASEISVWQSDVDRFGDAIPVPAGMRLVALDTGVSRRGTEDHLSIVRTTGRIAHAMILKKMRDIGEAAGRELVADPMGGFLGRLNSNDYKRWFRPYLSEALSGDDCREQLGAAIDVNPQTSYPVRGVADHYVLESMRVQNFVKFLTQARSIPIDEPARGIVLDKAGHLMYASHQSLSGDATLGCEQADLLVRLVRQRERRGLYGARLIGTGRGGIVVVLCEENERATTALSDVIAAYTDQTGLAAGSFRTMVS